MRTQRRGELLSKMRWGIKKLGDMLASKIKPQRQIMNTCVEEKSEKTFQPESTLKIGHSEERGKFIPADMTEIP